MIIMAKWLSILLVLDIMLFPTLVASNPLQEAEVYRLLLSDGQVIAYTEFKPYIGDYYWQAEQDVWYRVVRVEADIGWLEVTSPPTTEVQETSPSSLPLGTFILVALALILLCLYYRRRR